MASAAFDEHAEERRPTVQVGDPFTEKLLLEACLEAMQTGAIAGIQDMGAAGLACCTAEMPARSGTGMEVELERVPQRESAMTPYEILLSESQERMLLVAARGQEATIQRIFAKWELDAVEIGRVIAEPELIVRAQGAIVARVPIATLAEAPRYDAPRRAPLEAAERLRFDPLSLPPPSNLEEAALAVLGAPTVASKEWAYRQYDQQVGINTLVLPGSDAAVLRVKGTRRAIAVSADGNGRVVFLDPRRGAAMAVCEAARNVTCAGARPLGVTDCLNFGSPERPEILWQFAETVDGIAEACRALGLPVVGGNVSFYNETAGEAVLPTPVIGVVGVLEEHEHRTTQWFKTAGARIALLGPPVVSLGGSEYLWTLHGRLAGAPAPLDLELERRVQAACRAAIEAGLIASAHDCSEGGLAVAVAEAAVTGPVPLGATIDLPDTGRPDLTLFGEGPSRIVVSVRRGGEREFDALMAESAIPWTHLGVIGGGRLVVRIGGRTVMNLALSRIADRWRDGFERHMA
jgi:phosphoribosylformylglycinamidine synthase